MTLPYTTFKKLRKADVCKDRYKHLRKSLPGVKDNDPIDLVTILETNGIKDVLLIPEEIISGSLIEKRYRLFMVACCQDILHLMKDQRSIAAVKAAHLFAYGEISIEELDIAWWDVSCVAEAEGKRLSKK